IRTLEARRQTMGTQRDAGRTAHQRRALVRPRTRSTPVQPQLGTMAIERERDALPCVLRPGIALGIPVEAKRLGVQRTQTDDAANGALVVVTQHPEVDPQLTSDGYAGAIVELEPSGDGRPHRRAAMASRAQRDTRAATS